MSDVASDTYLRRALNAPAVLSHTGRVGGGSRNRISVGALRMGYTALDAGQVAAFGAVVSLAAASDDASIGSLPDAVGTGLLGAFLAVLVRQACGRGACMSGRAGRIEAVASAASVLIAVATITACFSVARPLPMAMQTSHFVWGVGSALISAALWFVAEQAAARGGLGARRVAVVGCAAEAAGVAGAIAANRERLCWTVAQDVRDAEPGQMNALRESAINGDIDVVVLAAPAEATERIRAIEAALLDAPVHLCLAVQLPAPLVPRCGAGGPAFIGIAEYPHGGLGGVLKRAMDVALSSLAILAFAPLLGLVALLIRLDSPGPLLFRQQRFGAGSRPIQVLKFRTMRADLGDASGERRTVARDPRVTRVGRVLRRTSLDELPQLFNVLRGDMSLVGPRPHAMFMKVGKNFYFDVVDGYRARHRVRPGITGWAQINGLRGEVDSPEKAHRRIQYDIWYIENWSLALDLGIIFRTLFGGFATFRAD